MGLFDFIHAKTREARAKEKIRPLLESRMMRDILLEIGQRGTEPLDPQSVPPAQRERAAQLVQECGTAGLKQSAVDALLLNETAITLVCNDEETVFRYSDYNYENIEDTDCLPAVAQYLVQHMRGYYDVTGLPYTVPKNSGRKTELHIRAVEVRRHHEDTPFDPGPVPRQKLF